MNQIDITIGSGIEISVKTKGQHVIVAIDGEAFVFPASTARRIAAALTEAAESAELSDLAR